MTNAPVVAIVGRPNVGKSTLFNRIIGARVAIVEKTPGVTRDRIYEWAEWRGRRFLLVDTGGIDVISGKARAGAGSRAEDELEIMQQTRRQAEIAIAESDIILFVVDARDGVTPADHDIAGILRRSGKPVLLVANKLEGKIGGHEAGHMDLYELGLGDAFPISAVHGEGVGDLLDAVIESMGQLPGAGAAEGETGEAETTGFVIKIAVIGRPNVGKSSLVNKILGEERFIVSDVPGTTRDAIDTLFRHGDQEFRIIDTAGIRRKSRIRDQLERYSVLRALRAIDRCDVAVLVLDALEGPTEQETKIGGYIHEAGRGCIIAVNKWDLVKDRENVMTQLERDIRDTLGFLDYAPIVFISAVTGKRVETLLQMIKDVFARWSSRIPTSTLNQVIQEAVVRVEPPSHKGRELKVYYGTQVRSRPPAFAIYVNDPDLMHFSYERYLENTLREAFGFEGTRIELWMRRKT
ncbi:MAG: ribosome biogenesis GTPase Der [Firmicutes bacterium]|nr:ribosome biogenesis GTPase Der [Bacillota bacterium]